MNYINKFSLILLILFSFLSLKSSIGTKKDSDLSFSFNNTINCQFSVILAQTLYSFSNKAHIKGFLVMSLLAIIGFTNRRILKAGGFVVVLTLATEGLQMWSPSRHCRVTDLIPNLLGYFLAVTIYLLFFHIFKRFYKRSYISK